MASSVLRAIDLLEELSRRSEPSKPSEIADACGFSRPTTYRLLHDLLSRGFVVRVGRGQYQLGQRVLGLAIRMSEQMDLVQAGRSELESVAAAAQETAHLGILADMDVLYIGKVDSPKSIRMYSYVGMRIPAYATAMGRAILAFRPPDEVERFIENNEFAARTERTVRTAEAFRDQLDTTRDNGYAIDDRENDTDIRCVAAPIFDHRDDVVGALSVSALEFRKTRQQLIRDIAPIVVDAADRIGRALGHRARNS